MHPREAEALERPQHEIALSMSETAELLGTGAYQPDRGLYRGRHWRRGHGSGCWHLRMHRGRCWVHWDRWDPRRHPYRHTWETPELAYGLPSATAVLGALVGLGIRKL